MSRPASITARSLTTLAALALVLAPLPGAAISPTSVVATKRLEIGASSNADWLAWTQDVKDHPADRLIRILSSSGPGQTLTGPGQFFAGTVDPTGSQLAYQRVRDRHSDVHLWDLQTESEIALPDGMNTGAYEWGPSVSGGSYAFIRRSVGQFRVYLVTDLATGDKVLVDFIWRYDGAIVSSTNLQGNWLVYSKCIERRGCNVYRYDIASDVVLKVPNPDQRYEYAPSVDLSGTVYFAKSGVSCGSAVHLMKWTGSGDPTVVWAYGKGRDTGATSVYDDGAGTVTLYSDLQNCRVGSSDIIAFTNP
jgi:hypothetical protein